MRFENGGRNVRHTHSFDQVLYVVDGEGVVATDDEERRIRPGDLVVIPAGEPHSHGAADGASTTHLAIGVPGTSEFDGGAFGSTE